ncbi:MAG: CpXC domain-containing protein, partial [Chloroflexales bacterium]|nr:CpXC domain-containing protein [Chloroflexales bacterium]
MPAIAPQPVQITCPNCRTSFRTGIYSLVDAGEQPELKQALLAGQLNLAICPNCGVASALGAPLVYHDAAKQLCFVYFPQELRARPEEQERFVGDVTNFLIKSLPADAPRGYLLKPRRFISQASLIEAIFESDGISKEMLDAQRQRVALIAEFAQAMEDEPELARLAEQHRAALDYEFFATLTAFADANAQQGRMDGATMLAQLRDRLAALAGVDLPDEADGFADGVDGGVDANYEAELAQTVERLV